MQDLFLRMEPSAGNDAEEIYAMLSAWCEQAAKYKSGEISEEDYDKWRYRFPEFDTTQAWGGTLSAEMSDALVDAFKDKLKD